MNQNNSYKHDFHKICKKEKFQNSIYRLYTDLRLIKGSFYLNRTSVLQLTCFLGMKPQLMLQSEISFFLLLHVFKVDLHKFVAWATELYLFFQCQTATVQRRVKYPKTLCYSVTLYSPFFKFRYPVAISYLYSKLQVSKVGIEIEKISELLGEILNCLFKNCFITKYEISMLYQ